MKILIVKLSSIGDIVHALPALAAIKKALPDAEVSWAAERGAAEILRRNQTLTRLIEIDTRELRRRKGLRTTLMLARAQLKDLRATSYDAAIDFQGLLKSAGVAKLSGAKHRYGFAGDDLREPASRFLLTETFEISPRTHIIKKNLSLAAQALKINVPEADFDFPIYTADEHRREAENIISQTGENFVILNPAGGWATKLWSAEKFGALADRLWAESGMTCVVATAPGETALAEKVLSASRSGRVFPATPTLKGFYELARRAKLYVGGDTGPTHLAVAAKAPIVGIFGPTEWWRNGSPDPSDICVERFDIDCRTDCHRRNCSNWICLDIEVETVFRAAQKRLETSSRQLTTVI